MMDYRYNDKIETDIDKNVLTPIVVLCTRSGRKIGVINNVQEFRCSHPLNDVSEISFDIYKEVNGIKNIYWDFIKDFKFIFLPTVNDPKYKWYEITVNIDESNDTIKHITGIHANEAELGQLELYNVEINTENDIDRNDYEVITIDGKEYGTVFFNPEHPKASLLHRLLSDKASHYSIIHVDSTLQNIQREFSFNGTSIVDALKQTIAPEIGCLFIFGESDNNIDDSIFHRTISAYDLMDYCEDCGERGNYSHGVCTNCGSHNIKSGYGKDTGIFINAENLTDSISFTSNTDQVKNFFKMGAGDEYMEAAIRNCNPNGSNYLFYFSDEMKEDMSDELVEKLNEYEIAYDGYLKNNSINLPTENVNKYNILVNKYQSYIKENIPIMNNIVTGYTELTNYDYNAVNFKDCLQTTMMPSSPDVAETTADEQIAKLTVESMSPIGTEDSSALSLTAANTAVESYAKVYIDTSRYKIEIIRSSYANSIWEGTIRLTSLTDDEDTASKDLTIIFNNDGAQFLKQKIQKMMEEHKVEDIGDVSFLQQDYTDAELESVFKPKLQKYSLDALSLLDDLCSATMDILADANQGTADSLYYEDFYHPYWKKRKLIMEEESVREEEIKTIEQIIEDIDNVRTDIINILDMHNFFGEELYSELMLYRRETEYSNSNFISDGLTDSEVISRAQDYFKRVQEEIIKASTIQHSINCSLYNLFLLPEFRQILVTDDSSQIQYIGEGLYVDGNEEVHNIGDEPQFTNSTLKRFIELFEGGNWLRVRVDDKVYKLRLTNWEIDYTKPEELEVEFSDVIYSGDTMSDITSLLSQARTMATSYNTIMRQAEKGNIANQAIERQKKQGLILNQNKIINDVDTQNFVLNSQGALMRAKNDFDDGYGPEQIKLLNKGIYYTNDDWETVKAGLGHFIYYDPITKTAKEDYGIIASTIVGQLLLGENLKIFSESGKFEMGDDGLKITAIEGENNTDLFVVQKQKVDAQGRDYVEKYIYVDSDGNVSITGNSIIVENKPLIEYIDDVIEDVEVSVSLPVTIQIDSSAGIVFKTNNISTVFTATVYKGGEDITSEITEFKWTKKDKNGNIDTSWTRTTNSNSLTVNNININEKIIFDCEVTITQAETITTTSGSITIVEIQDGSQFWTTTVEPTSPNYTFTISNLTGNTNADIKVGDIIYYSHYRYVVTTVNIDGTTVLCGNRESLRGGDGISPTVKSIICSHSAIVCEKDGTYNPDIINFNGQAIYEDTINDYQGWFVIEVSSDAEHWVTAYSSSSKEPSVSYKIPLGLNITKNGILYLQDSTVTTGGSIIDSDFIISSEGVISTTQDVGFIIRSIRCSLYSDANKTNLIDQQRVNVAFDGVDGDKGDDGYTVILTNENHTFAGNSTSAIDSYTECNVIAYIGNVQTTCKIGQITGCPTGMTATVKNNDTTSAKFEIAVTSAMTSQNGVLNIPVTVNDETPSGKLFNMKFTYSLKLNGLDATGLGWMVNYSTTTTPNNGECVYYGFDEITKQPNNNKDGWVLWNGQEVTIPHGCHINPNGTMPYGNTVYNVYRLPNSTTYINGVFHDITWIENTNSWLSNTYDGTFATADVDPWIWNEDTDIILSMYVEPSEEGAITNAQLFTPPKKYSELVEPAKGMAKDAEKTAINYMSSDSSGIMIADLRNGYYLPSNPDLVGQNVFIDSTKVDIRDGEDSLAVFGETTRIGDSNGRNVTIDNNSVDIMSGNVSIASFAQSVRVGRDILPHMTINPTNISAYSGNENGNENLYFQVGDGSITAYQTYNVDALPIELTLNNPIYDLTSILINNQQVSDYSFYINETSVSIDDRPPEAITIVVNYQYEVTDYSESTDETTTQIITTSQTFEYPKIDLSIPLEYPDIYITNVTPSILDGTFSYDDNNIIFSPRPQSGTVINIEYYLNQSARQPYFTFNGRNSNGEVGSGSISFANNGIASGESSFVTGIDSRTTGKASFSSGEYNVSSGEAGSTMGKNLNNNAIGGMAIGTYNVQSPNSIFTVGNGTSDLDRRNALTVASNGNSIFAGRLFSGTHINDAKPMFKVEAFGFTSIGIRSGHGYGAERNINRTGYIPIAIAGFQILDNQPNGKYSLWCVPTRVYIDYISNNYVLRFYIWNQHSSEMAIVRFVAKVLYIASSTL